MKRSAFGFLVASLFAIRGFAVPPPETSLNTCQATVQNEGKKFVQNTVTAVGTCLKRVAADLIKNTGPVSAATGKACVAQFRKLNDTRTPPADKDITRKFRDAVTKKCEPLFTPSVTHTINDITAHAGGGVTEKIKTVNADLWCKHFGGDGSIDSVSEWEDCLVASFNCEAAAAIASQFPRAGEWLNSIGLFSAMGAVVAPPTDASRTADAINGVTIFNTTLDPDFDGIPNPSCGGGGVACTTACCYVENTAPNSPEVSCYEYTGPAASIGTFLGGCAGTTSIPAVGGPGAQVHTGVVGPCFPAPSPLNLAPCLPGLNRHVLPTDASCP